MSQDFGLKLTENQKEILNQLVECRKNNSSISVRTIAAELNISTSLVSYTIKQFEKWGILKRNIYNPKDFNLIFSPSKTPVHFVKFIEARCGANGSLNEDHLIDSIPIPIHQFSILNADRAILVKAKGDSMEPKIYENDMVLVEKTEVYHAGRIYLVIHNGEALIKKYRVLNDHGILESLNASYNPIPVSEDTRIIAEVKGIIRNKSI